MPVDDLRFGKLIERLGIPVLFGCLTVLFFSEVIFSSKLLIHRDIFRYYYPLRHFCFSLLKSGQVPLWNPYIYMGNPMLATLQSCVFYPISLLYLTLPFDTAFNWFIFFHFFLAQIFCYLLLRFWRLSVFASILGAVTFAFSGYLVSVTNLITTLSSVVWIPLVIIATQRMFSAKSFRWALANGLFLTLTFLGGEPTIVYLCGIFVGFYTVCMIFKGRRRGSFNAFKIIFYPLISFFMFLGLSAAQLLPFLEYLTFTERGKIPLDIALQWSMPPYDFLNLLVPFIGDLDLLVKGYWERQSWLLSYYLGILPLLLFPIAVASKRKIKWALLATLLVGLIMVLGRHLPFYALCFNFIPGFKMLRYPIKFYLLVTLSLSFLTAFGYDNFLRRIQGENKKGFFLYFLFVVGILSAVGYLLTDKNFGGAAHLFRNWCGSLLDYSNYSDYSKENLIFTTVSNIRRTFLYLAVFSCLLIFFRFGKKGRTLAGFGIFLFLVMDLFFTHKGMNYALERDLIKKPAENVEFVKQDDSLSRFISSPKLVRLNMSPPESDYVSTVLNCKARFIDNFMMIYGLQTVVGNESAERERAVDVFKRIYSQKRPDENMLLDLFNAKYLITPEEIQVEGFRLLKKNDVSCVYLNEGYFPRVFLVDEIYLAKDKKDAIRKLFSEDFNPAEEVIIEGDAAIPKAFLKKDLGGFDKRQKAEIISYAPHYVKIESNLYRAGALVFTDSFYPGWRAFVNGKPARILRADYLFRALFLRPGKNVIEMRYRPLSFRLGAGLSFAAILVGLFFVITSLIKTCRKLQT